MKSRTHGRGESPDDERSTAFPSFHSGEALAVIGTGRTPAEHLARSCALSPRMRSKKGWMMPHLPSLISIDCVATLCPPAAPMPKAENILKTKGRKRAFSPAKAENILKKSQLQETMGTPKEHDKMTAGRDPQGRRQAAEKAGCGEKYRLDKSGERMNQFSDIANLQSRINHPMAR